ncbi:putative RNA uridine N3 methyltransferase [Halarchaeum salinum]|uniref:RNA uridine N3 methyltransferase n=1 Tax=Halarchaeum salinum TaxID=489912 RepID=A0AAV3SAM5_9EURY
MTRSVLVPSSVCREAEDKREATRKLGYVARAAAVFRADRLVVFPDPDGERRWGVGFVETVLRYAATPPYLRKEAFDTRDELEYAGVLPPLRLSSWTGSESSGSGSHREGIVTQVGSEGRVRVNCGMQHPISLHLPDDMEVLEGERVTIRVSSRRPVRAKIVEGAPAGFQVFTRPIGDELDRPDAGFRVATSRFGVPVGTATVGDLTHRVHEDGLTVAFGSPERGLPPMLGLTADAIREFDLTQSTRAPGGFDTWLNTIPDQGSEVVRTEEAMFASLACLTLTE